MNLITVTLLQYYCGTNEVIYKLIIYKFEFDKEGGLIMRGDRVKQLRKEMKWTQEELGNRVDLKKSTISEIENNKKDAGRKAITKIATVLNCTTDYLLGLSDDPELKEEENKIVTEEGKNIMALIESLPEEERKKAWEQLEMYVTYMQNKKND